LEVKTGGVRAWRNRAQEALQNIALSDSLKIGFLFNVLFGDVKRRGEQKLVRRA